MNIAYSCNDYYIPQTGISMISLFENNKDVEELCVYFISKDVSESNVTILRNIADNYDRQFREIKFDDIAYDLNLSNTGRHIATIYTKVFFPRINGVDKMIYFDSDTVVVGSLKDLWEDNLDGYYMGAVETFPTKYYKELGLPKGDRFFNDGMAICNVAFCRDNHLIEKVLKVVEEFNGNPPTLSEGALNKVCYGKIKYISLRYNLMAGILYQCNLDINSVTRQLHYSVDELRDSCKNPVVIHYLTAFYGRPWFKNCTHPYKDEFFKYKKLSPWKDEPLKENRLPLKIKLIDLCYRVLGVRNTERIREVLGLV